MSTNEKYDLRGYQTNKPTIFLDLDGTVLDTDRYKLETYPDIDYPDLPSSIILLLLGLLLLLPRKRKP